ncbi:hypothetical protein NDU88_002887 [Pleurodeles waltl]|uniref:Uncharacterized protein n=1 Tax=Pleurodeles waltl TaxID=8319 RepID=A0AAV7SBU6_PLEWA|nr:hypothetical protein NDU88_002887 [Pleurodeles waltl]
MKALMRASQCHVPVGLGPLPGALGLLGPVVSQEDWICCCLYPVLWENESAYERKSVPVGLGRPPVTLGLLGPVVSPQDWICSCSRPALWENESVYECESVPVGLGQPPGPYAFWNT